MARIPLPGPDDPDVDPKTAAVLRALEARQKAPAYNVQRALANHPELMEAMWAMANITYFKNSLDPVQRELAYYTSAVTNECFY